MRTAIAAGGATFGATASGSGRLSVSAAATGAAEASLPISRASDLRLPVTAWYLGGAGGTAGGSAAGGRCGATDPGSGTAAIARATPDPPSCHFDGLTPRIFSMAAHQPLGKSLVCSKRQLAPWRHPPFMHK